MSKTVSYEEFQAMIEERGELMYVVERVVQANGDSEEALVVLDETLSKVTDPALLVALMDLNLPDADTASVMMGVLIGLWLAEYRAGPHED